MKTIFYNKLFFGLSVSFLVSYLFSRLLAWGSYSFTYAMSFFGALYLMLGWITYLRLDGVYFFRKKRKQSASKQFDYRFSYKKKGVYNIDKDYGAKPDEDIPDNKALKAAIFAYLSCAAILFIASHIYFNRIVP